jgi:hypothetical protein
MYRIYIYSYQYTYPKIHHPQMYYNFASQLMNELLGTSDLSKFTTSFCVLCDNVVGYHNISSTFKFPCSDFIFIKVGIVYETRTNPNFKRSNVYATQRHASVISSLLLMVYDYLKMHANISQITSTGNEFTRMAI